MLESVKMRLMALLAMVLAFLQGLAEFFVPDDVRLGARARFAENVDAQGTAGRFVGTALSVVVGFVAIAVVVEIQNGNILGNASALVQTVVSFVPVILSLALLWFTWSDTVGL